MGAGCSSADRPETSVRGIAMTAKPECVAAFLEETLEVLRAQRAAIASRDWDSLAQSLDQLRTVMHRVASIAGGPAGLRSSIEVLDGEVRERARTSLEHIQAERQATSELIRLNLQRFQNLEAFLSTHDAGATAGESKSSTGRRLSTWV